MFAMLRPCRYAAPPPKSTATAAHAATACAFVHATRAARYRSLSVARLLMRRAAVPPALAAFCCHSTPMFARLMLAKTRQPRRVMRVRPRRLFARAMNANPPYGGRNMSAKSRGIVELHVRTFVEPERRYRKVLYVAVRVISRRRAARCAVSGSDPRTCCCCLFINKDAHLRGNIPICLSHIRREAVMETLSR